MNLLTIRGYPWEAPGSSGRSAQGRRHRSEERLGSPSMVQVAGVVEGKERCVRVSEAHIGYARQPSRIVSSLGAQ
jgi:hypothetical protein